MATDLNNLMLVCGVAAAVNIVNGIDKGKDLVPMIVGSCVAFAGLAIVGGLTGRWELPVAFAWVFLLAALVFRGLPLVQKSGLLTGNTVMTYKNNAGDTVTRTTKPNGIYRDSVTNSKTGRRSSSGNF